MRAGSGTGAGGLRPEAMEKEDTGLGGSLWPLLLAITNAAAAGEGSCAAGVDNRETSPVT